MSGVMEPWAAVQHEDDADPWEVRHHEDDATAPGPTRAAKPPADKPKAAPSHHATTPPSHHEAPPLDLAPVIQAIAEMADDITNALHALTAAIKERFPPAG